MNGEPIILTDGELRQQYFDLRWLRKTMMKEGPITNPEITKVEAALLNHPLTTLEIQFSVITRMIVASALLYELADDPALKHKMLLSARQHLHEIQQFPEEWFLALAPFYGEWMDALNREEEEECCA